MAGPGAEVARPEVDEVVVFPGPAPRRRRPVRERLRWTPRVEQVGAVALVALALLPLAVTAVRVLAALGDAHPTMGDTALLELGVRRIGSEPLLLGPYSRFGWLHPGPAPFVALAPAYWSTGGHALGLNLGALVLNAGCIVGVAVLAWRRGGAPLLAWAVALLALLLHLLGPGVLRNPWNPYLAILPLALLVLLAWSIACGSRWSLPVAVAVGSAIVQTHVGYGPVVAVLLAGSVVLLATRSRSGLGRPLLVTGAVAVVLWAPTVLEELAHDPGNVSTLRTYLESERDTQGLRAGVQLAAAQLGRLPASAVGIDLGGEESGLATGGPKWPIAVSIAALTVATVVAWRRRLPDVLRLVPLVVLFAAASVFAASGIDGLPYAYLVTWMTVGGFLVWLAVAAALVPWRRGAGRVPAMLTAAVVVAALSIGGADAAADPPLPEADVAAVMAELVPQVDEALPPGDCPVLVRWSGNASWAWGVGVVVALHKDGHDVRVDRRWRFMFGEDVARGSRGGPTLLVAAPDAPGTGPVVATRGGLRVHLQPGTC